MKMTVVIDKMRRRNSSVQMILIKHCTELEPQK